MKIKKVAQTPGVLATVSTSKIDSDKDTYSCNYLNDNAVVVSPTEPSDGKVWLERGKNLYNESQYPLTLNRALDTATGNFYSTTSSNWYGCENYMTINREAIEKITFSSVVNIAFYDSSKSFISGSGDKQTYDVPSNARYLRFDIHKNNINNIQIEQGEVATPYEPFTPKKIHTKTDNGYEEFYNEEEREVYSTGETRIGTFLGKPLYRQVFSGLQCPNNTVGTYTHQLHNSDKIIRIEGILVDKTSSNEYWPIIFGKYDNPDGIHLNLNQYSGTLYIVTTKDYSAYTCDVIVEYTKTTD